MKREDQNSSLVQTFRTSASYNAIKTHLWTSLAYNFFYNTTPKYTLHFKRHVKHNDKWWNGYSSIKKIDIIHRNKKKLGKRYWKVNKWRSDGLSPILPLPTHSKGRRGHKTHRQQLYLLHFSCHISFFWPHFCYFPLQILLHKKNDADFVT